MTRGIRNDNPLNIRRTATRWQGEREEQTDKEFVQFQSMAYGYRAAWRILQTYYNRFSRKGQPFTVSTVIARWAPPHENDTRAYIRRVLRLGGLAGNERLLPPASVSGFGRLLRLVMAMTCVECGTVMEQVDREAICKGYRLAFPENAAELDRWLCAEDEYSDW